MLLLLRKVGHSLHMRLGPGSTSSLRLIWSAPCDTIILLICSLCSRRPAPHPSHGYFTSHSSSGPSLHIKGEIISPEECRHSYWDWNADTQSTVIPVNHLNFSSNNILLFFYYYLRKKNTVNPYPSL